MELWIRSQDKTTLKEIKVIDIYTPEEYAVENYVIVSEGWELGKYKTKERALEVLDEIQHRLITLCDSMNRHLYVYEMPKE